MKTRAIAGEQSNIVHSNRSVLQHRISEQHRSGIVELGSDIVVAVCQPHQPGHKLVQDMDQPCM